MMFFVFMSFISEIYISLILMVFRISFFGRVDLFPGRVRMRMFSLRFTTFTIIIFRGSGCIFNGKFFSFSSSAGSMDYLL